MISEQVIKQLKRINISSDPEKTIERVREILMKASSEERKEIEESAGVARVSLNRIYKTGSISAKLAVPIAQTIGVDPFYLIGEADERGECTDDLLKEFLVRFGYGDLLVKTKRASKRSRKTLESQPGTKDVPDVQNEPDGAKPADGEDAVEYKDKQEDEPKQEPCSEIITTPENAEESIDDITEEDMLLLIRSVMLRAKLGSVNAAKILSDIRSLLLS